jgi:hypothetical protein
VQDSVAARGVEAANAQEEQLLPVVTLCKALELGKLKVLPS